MQRTKPNDAKDPAGYVNHYRPVSMTCFAAAVRAGPAQQSLATVKRPSGNRPSSCKPRMMWV